MSFRRSIVALVATVVVLSATSSAGYGQIDAIRRARAELSGKLPSVASLFGDQPPLTTSLDDAIDGVPPGATSASGKPASERHRRARAVAAIEL